MATKLHRPVTRETTEIDTRTHKPWLIRLEAGGRLVRVKVKGSRTWLWITVKQIVVQAAINRVAEVRAEKRARREEQRRARAGKV